MILNNIEIIPGTEIAIPRLDNAATKHIRLKRSLDWDDNFSTIPEIKELKPGDIVFDVGAWIGDTTSVFLNQGCRVHAFEPREDNFICLLNNCPDANCYNIALGDGGTYGTDKRGGNTGGYPLLQGNKKTIMLNSFWQNKIDFLKIDVEGFEGKVLRGGMVTIQMYHPTILIEINPEALRLFGETPDSIINILKLYSYTSFREVYNYNNLHWDIIAK